MTIQLINIGTTPNDGLGDPLRVAFAKINNNFSEVSNTSVAGSNTQVQFNDANALGASANFTYNKLTDTLTVGNIVGNVASIGIAKQPFTFSTSTVNVGLVPAGKIVNEVQVLITTAFDSTGATLRVGTSLSPSQLFSASDARIYQNASYTVITNTKYSVDTQVVLTVDAAGSTAGEGLLILTYE